MAQQDAVSERSLVRSMAGLTAWRCMNLPPSVTIAHKLVNWRVPTLDAVSCLSPGIVYVALPIHLAALSVAAAIAKAGDSRPFLMNKTRI